VVDNTLAVLPLLKEKVEDGYITLTAAQTVARQSSTTLASVESLAMQHSILPLRYKRNGLKPAEQLKLFSSTIAIIGCGGLGGRSAEILCRTGIGHLILSDPDFFSESNLNRQLFCTPASLGQPKVSILGRELLQINPALSTDLHHHHFDISSITGADIVIDALDSTGARKELAALCHKRNIPLVHGAVKGWYGQLGVESRSNSIINSLYQRPGKSTATPRVFPMTVALIAAMQATEACKLILDTGSVLNDGWLQCDLYNGDFEAIKQE